MKSWHQPPDLHYSFKSHFAWPTAPPVEGAAASAGGLGAGAAEAASAAAASAGAGGSGGYPPHGPRGYYTHGHGMGRGYYWRPRFGLFRRMVWFGLGVGAASWYIHHKQEKYESHRAISNGSSWSHHPHPPLPPPPNVNISEHRSLPPWQPRAQAQPEDPRQQDMSAILKSLPEAQQAPVTPVPVEETRPESPKWGWAARREERRRKNEEKAQLKKDALEIKEAIEKAWADSRKEVQAAQASQVQVQANDKAKAYARDKLEVLSRAVDKLREALDETNPSTEKKLV